MKSLIMDRVQLYVSYLCTLSSCGTHNPTEDLLNDIWQQADCNKQYDAEPGWTTREHLHEDIVHPLVVKEWPEQDKDKKKRTKTV